MRIARPSAARAPVSLVAMIDVLMILLVFFMVTSTYLNLTMIPVAQGARDMPVSTGPAAGTGPESGILLIRLDAAGRIHAGGRVLDGAGLEALLRARAARDPQGPVVVLPSGAADMQALARLMDAATRAGTRHLRLLRLEAQP